MSGGIDRICILDDDSSVLNSIRELLASDGFEAQLFDRSDKFLAYAQEHVVKVAVLDVWIPVTSGIEVQERLHDLSPSTCVIIMTGREVTAILTQALEGGAFAFLVKPFDDEVFLSAVRSALGDSA
jgi:two-component system response regulator FixJ